MTLQEIVLALMVVLQPPGRSIYSLTEVPEGSPPACNDATKLLCAKPIFDPARNAWIRPETYDEALARYWTIAQAIAIVAENTTWKATAECTRPPNVRVISRYGLKGTACERAAHDRPWSGATEELARYLVTVSYHESGFRRDVHSGIGKFSKGDEGRSWCLGQIMLGASGQGKTARGYVATAIVGVDTESTHRCLQTMADQLARARAYCTSSYGPGDAGPSCVTAVYGGSALLATTPVIRTRVITYRKIYEIWKKAALSPEIRKTLGIQSSQSSIASQDAAVLRQSRSHSTISDAWTFAQTNSHVSPFGVGSAAGQSSSFSRKHAVSQVALVPGGATGLGLQQLVSTSAHTKTTRITLTANRPQVGPLVNRARE
jgi:hypothetical protein